MSEASTNRVILREAVELDAAFFFELMNSEPWIKNIGDRDITDVDKAKEYIRNTLVPSYKNKGMGFKVIVRKQDLNPVGICGLIKRDWLKIPDLGFALLPAYFGNGLALEASRLILNNYNGDLNAITIPVNVKSIHLLEKLDFIRTGLVTDEKSKEELLLFFRKGR